MHRFSCRIPALGLAVWVIFAMGLAGCPPSANRKAPEANFTATPAQGVLPLTVQFTDTSLPGTSPIQIWFWDFGDGTYGSTPNPSHVYTAAGIYTASLTVESVEGKDTVTKVDLITVNVRSAFALIGPAGGAVSAGGAVVEVPANARPAETAVGITWLDGVFEVALPETTVVLSAPFRISHDGQDLGFTGTEGADSMVPTMIELPFLAGAVPVADRNGDKIHVIADLENGLDIPIFGQVQGDRIIAPVTGLPNRATYGVVYRPGALSRMVTPSGSKALTGTAWPGQWRVRLSALVAQQLTALRVGEIDNTAPYLRTDFAAADVDATLDALDEIVLATATAFDDAGLRTPVLLNNDGAYELALYNFSGPYSTDYERYADVLLAVRTFGTLVIDSRQLINVSLHNAENTIENPDGAQELSVENAFAQELYLASFEGYDYPLITTASPTDDDMDGNPRQISFAQALVNGVAAYAGQMAAGFEVARTFDPGDISLLSESLFAPFSEAAAGYAAATQDFLLFLARTFDVAPFEFVFATDTENPGIVERVRAALATLPGTPSFARATEELRFAANDAVNTYFGQTLTQLYWRFAQVRGVEAGVLAVLRPSDTARERFTLQADQFGANSVVEAGFAGDEASIFVGPDEEPALRDIPPLSSRAVVVGLDPETPSLTLTFDREDWMTDSLGNSVAVKAYPEGKSGVALEQGASSLVLDLLTEICPLPEDPALLIQILFPLFDIDDNGGLSLAEAQALEPSISELVFSFADLDSDGVLSLTEVLTLVPVVFPDPLALIDTNENGYLERDELAGLSDQEFALLDENGNGAFDCGDLPPPDGKRVDQASGETARVIVLISNLNLSAANSVYVNATRPPAMP